MPGLKDDRVLCANPGGYAKAVSRPVLRQVVDLVVDPDQDHPPQPYPMTKLSAKAAV